MPRRAPAPGECAPAQRAPAPFLTYGQLLAAVGRRLGDRLEARRIIEAAASVPSAALIAMLEDGVPSEIAARAVALSERRASGEPLQHVVGRWGFRTLDVLVDKRALVPRPETELLVDLALSRSPLARTFQADRPIAVDLGTGSGVIALSLVAEHPSVEVFAVEASAAAFELAGENLAGLDRRLARRVRLLHGSWFAALGSDLRGRVDLVVSNPPYLAADEWADLDPVVRDYDPVEALVAGPSGLEAIEAVVAGAPGWLSARGVVLVEIAPHQASAAARVARQAGLGVVEVVADLAGRSRVLCARGLRQP